MLKSEYEILKEANKVVLAYSGGLDTSVMVTWLKEHGVKEVICVSVDLGQVKDPDALETKALGSGASKFYNINVEEEFIDQYAFKSLKADAKYENVYLLGTAIARPLISKVLVDIAKKEEAEVIVHGCTGKGNDQIRFEVSIMALAPEIKVVAPWRFWDIKGRSEEEAYAKEHGIELKVTKEEDYSMDENIWHLSHEGLDLEDPANSADLEKVLYWVTPPEKAADNAEVVELEFEKGIPVALNGEKLKGFELVKKLNEIAGKHGIGIDDIVESRMVGMKSRGVYENPAASVLYFAHEKLETVTIHPDALQYKQKMAHDYAELVYAGKWMTPLKEAMDAFVDVTQENVTGKVKVKLYKGNMQPAGITAKNSLYLEEYATFEEDDVYNQSDATGFINLFGLSSKIYSKAIQESEDK
ncbi:MULTISPECIES: argininosuccinate synthase [Anaerococcus]|uniref:Argininosuccinate synthase n=1 Tax=Anaerococcus nagyae TaxID=1755241 RepID=A0A3E2TGF2_9FIRM|nr:MULTISPECIES: argininosuccinate synthase [Anaerococcus]MDU1828503.1 argininosuccinate synthase [Anaerococcus sp.]MDU1864766.1 argininosuccinate synthase [Anaerococcus sp.]MDU2565880.1 argininosuccinate synthase [Anaerococcus sp.]RGB75127.1 argininosuccinate synthase [Anaerococcus nagyae]